jgi:hypothetical protein
MGEKRRHRGNDPGAIRAGQGQDELMIGHGGRFHAKQDGFSALLYHRRWACANPGRGIMMNKTYDEQAL